jgi:hypothetical protein
MKIKKSISSEKNSSQELYEKWRFLSGFLNKAKDLLLEWAEENDVHIHKVDFLPAFDLSKLQIYIFYDFESDKEKYKKNGTSKQIQELFLNSLRDLMCFKHANEDISFKFDSHQNVLTNYNYGSYEMYYRS